MSQDQYKLIIDQMIKTNGMMRITNGLLFIMMLAQIWMLIKLLVG